MYVGIALSEERQLNGYRVRLRVVEEYDVPLLAESPVFRRLRKRTLTSGIATPAERDSSVGSA
jgi:hypothetical protein